jgi:hypothetical protein
MNTIACQAFSIEAIEQPSRQSLAIAVGAASRPHLNHPIAAQQKQYIKGSSTDGEIQIISKSTFRRLSAALILL